MKQLSKKSLTEHRGFTKAENKQDIFLKQRVAELEKEYADTKAELRDRAITK